MAHNSHQQQHAFYLDQLSLQCKAGCGFYGNSEWFGYCSICYKQQHQLISQQQPPQPNPDQQPELVSSSSATSAPTPTPQSQPQPQLPRATSAIKSNVSKLLASPSSMLANTFSTIQSSIVNTAKSSFRVSSNLLSDTSSILSENMSTSRASNNQQSSASISQQAKDQFQYERAWTDCLRHTQKFTDEFLKRQADYSIPELSDIVHEFYHRMSDRFENHHIYKGASSDQVDLLTDNMERILNEHIYQPISARIINEDEEHNMAIQKRIKSLNRITVEHLEIDINFNDPVVHNILDRAICQIVEMNSRTSTIDKLDCIVSCSKTILELLQFTNSGQSVPVGADQFLPVLVFVVIQANPPMLPADMKYLTRFSNPSRLMSGETGYYFTNLCCALEFIEKASGASLNISEEEFAKYISGEVIPETKSQFNTYLCDGLRTMCFNQATLEDLKNRREIRSKKIDELFELIEVHMEANKAKLRELETFSASFKEKLKPNLSQDYLDLYAREKEQAIKLIPSYLRQSFMMRLEPETRLIDVQTTTTTTAETQDQQAPATASNLIEEAQPVIGAPSLSPVEQLESSIELLKLPDPIQPEPVSPTISTKVHGKQLNNDDHQDETQNDS